MIPLIERTFDMKVFMDFPRCRAGWFDKDKNGCILTAFLAGFGILPHSLVLEDDGISRHKWKDTLLSGRVLKINDIIVLLSDLYKAIHSGHSSHDVFSPYDRGEFNLAFDLLWQVIEKLPNKINCSSIDDVRETCVSVLVCEEAK